MIKKSATTFAILALLVSAPVVLAQDKAQTQSAPRHLSPRQPRGIYAVVLAFDHHPYLATMDNPAISGLFLYFDWATLEPKQGQFDFSALEEAFKIADSKHKTLQIGLLPGFSTPGWLLEELPSCDGWLASGGSTGPAPPHCGKATFGFPEGVARKGEMHELPLPRKDRRIGLSFDASFVVSSRRVCHSLVPSSERSLATFAVTEPRRGIRGYNGDGGRAG
jgi:hypothetical protein